MLYVATTIDHQLSLSTITVPGSRTDRVDLSVRQLYAFAMRYHRDLPPDPEQENPVTMPRARADPAVLRRFADRAARVGFKSDEIEYLQQYPASSAARPEPQHVGPYLVAAGPGLPKMRHPADQDLREGPGRPVHPSPAQ
jgi:hypothetical protein